MEDPFLNYFGLAGEAAIYTEHLHELSLLRKILLRMRSWQNYVFPEALWKARPAV